MEEASGNAGRLNSPEMTLSVTDHFTMPTHIQQAENIGLIINS